MSDQPAADDRAVQPGSRPALPAPGDLLVRNHDAEAHHLAVRAYDGDGAVVAAVGVHLPGGATVARPASLPSGTCTVEVDCDGHESARFADGGPDAAASTEGAARYLLTTCELGSDERLEVAVGNGVLDVVPLPAGERS